MKRRLLVIVPVLVALAAAPAFAQISRPERPYRGLFGGGSGNYEQSLAASLSLGGGYDGDVLAGDTSLTPEAQAGNRSSSFGQASAGLQYSLSRSKISLGASFSTSATYVPILVDPIVPQYAAGAGTSGQITSRTRVSADASWSYQPTYSLTGFVPAFEPELGTPPLDQFGLGAHIENHSSTSASIELSQDLTRRVSAYVNYGIQRSNSVSDAYSMASQSAGAGFHVGIASGLSFRAGYRRSFSRAYASGERYSSDGIDAGLDFSKALSLSRRTKLSFSSGVTSVSDRIETRHTAIGQIALTRELGRSWSAVLNYGRTVAFADTFLQPVFSDGITASITGLLSRRVQVQSSLGVSDGSVGFGDADNGFTSYYGTTGLTVGVTRLIGISVDYTYYRYQFDSAVILPPGYRRQSDRQGVHAYMNLQLPLFQRAGRSNASR